MTDFSPLLVQGGLEVISKVSVKVPNTVKNYMLIDGYNQSLCSETKKAFLVNL